MEPVKEKKLSISIPAELHKELKLISTIKNVSMKDYIIHSLVLKIFKDKKS